MDFLKGTIKNLTTPQFILAVIVGCILYDRLKAASSKFRQLATGA